MTSAIHKPRPSECRNTENPKCPNCGHEDLAWWESSGEWLDEEQRELCCPECGRGYSAIITYYPTFKTFERPDAE